MPSSQARISLFSSLFLSHTTTRPEERATSHQYLTALHSEKGTYADIQDFVHVCKPYLMLVFQLQWKFCIKKDIRVFMYSHVYIVAGVHAPDCSYGYMYTVTLFLDCRDFSTDFLACSPSPDSRACGNASYCEGGRKKEREYSPCLVCVCVVAPVYLK